MKRTEVNNNFTWQNKNRVPEIGYNQLILIEI